jgi:mannonate dehydratase
MRWFGPSDPVSLANIAQVPCVKGIVTALFDIPVGEVWSIERLTAIKSKIEAAGLTLDVIESIPVAEEIKLGLPERDALIDNYCQSIRHLGQVGIKTLCYNFMPVFDWMRTDMAITLPDGSLVSGYRHAEIENFDIDEGMEARIAWVYSYTGDQLRAVLNQYKSVDADALFENFAYFLRKVVPVAESAGVYLALHPDDPPWPIFGLPRIVRDLPTIQRILDVFDSPHNGLTFCTGSLGASLDNDLPAMIRAFQGRINFFHTRNVKVTGDKDFVEAAHLPECGTVDMVAVIQALVDIGFDGPIRPDHGRMIWGETGNMGYGLYDRSLGAMYLHGLYQGMHANGQ